MFVSNAMTRMESAFFLSFDSHRHRLLSLAMVDSRRSFYKEMHDSLSGIKMNNK